MTEIYSQIKMYRQGDVLLKQIARLPPNIRVKKDKKVAEGEIAGHAHLIKNGTVLELLNQNDKLFVKAGKKTVITHEEHNPIKLDVSIYEVMRQREYLGEGYQPTYCCH